MKNLNVQIQRYLQFCITQKKLNSKTVKAYRIDLRQYEEFIKQECLTLSKESLAIFIAKMNESYSPRSVKRKIASIKAFCNYLEDEDLLDKNPFNKLHVTLREPSRLPRTIPLRVIESILASAHNAASIGMTQYARKNALRDAAVMELLFATGMRVSELSHLDVRDIDLNDGTIMIYGKGSKERLVHIGSSDVLSILNEYYQQFGSPTTGPFFLNRSGSRLSEQSVRGIINKYAAEVCTNIHITPHMFRHSFASFLLEEDVDIRYIQQMLGHSSITTTQIYTHVSMAKQKDILVNKHPRNKMTL